MNLRCSRGGFYYKYQCYLENSNENLFSSKTNLKRRSTTQPSSTMFLHQLSLQISRTKIDLSLKWLGRGQLNPSCSFFKNVFSRERMKPWFFVTLYIIISHIFPENFIGMNFSNRSEDMKNFSVNINYFHQFFKFFYISFLQRN